MELTTQNKQAAMWHRLSSTVEALIDYLQAKKDADVGVPASIYYLQMIANAQQGLIPCWTRYEVLCQEEDWTLIPLKCVHIR